MCLPPIGHAFSEKCLIISNSTYLFFSNTAILTLKTPWFLGAKSIQYSICWRRSLKKIKTWIHDEKHPALSTKPQPFVVGVTYLYGRHMIETTNVPWPSETPGENSVSSTLAAWSCRESSQFNAASRLWHLSIIQWSETVIDTVF